jgi:protein O-GlcNAc transferase
MPAPRRPSPDEALAAYRRGDRAAAERLLRAGLARDPEDTEALGLLGTVRARRGDLAGAADLLERAARRDPKDAAARINLGNVYRRQGRAGDAVAAFRAAVGLAPSWPEALTGLAAALLDHAVRGDKAELNEAERLCRSALRHRADFADGYNVLGTVLKALGRPKDAEAAFRSAIQHAPRHGPALSNLGNLLAAAGRQPEALALYEAALAADPDNPDTRYNLGNTLFEVGRIEAAARCFRDVLARRPDHRQARHNLLFALCHLPDVTPEALSAEHRAQGQRMAAEAGARARTRHANAPDLGRRLKVGYLSPDFRAHPVTYFSEPVLAHHNPAVVEVTCYANVAAPDERTERLKALVPRWRDVTALSVDALAERIAADGIDVLVDLAGYTRNTRIDVLALRPAPVQVAYLGYPATTGLAAVGWRVTDAACDPPDAEAFYTERLARLPVPFCCYAAPEEAPPVAPAPAGATGRVTFGTLVNPKKLNGPVIALWARVLEAVPDARLLVFRTTLRDAALRKPFEDAFAAHGLGTDRVTFDWELPKAGHLAVYARVDACLDTFPFCGHTTTCEALWMGVPTVTLAGSFFAGRMGASLLPAVGLPQLVAADPDEFVAAAARLAADPAALAELRRGLRDRVRASPLCDGAGFTRHLEAAYRAMWEDWCRGQAG